MRDQHAHRCWLSHPSSAHWPTLSPQSQRVFGQPMIGPVILLQLTGDANEKPPRRFSIRKLLTHRRYGYMSAEKSYSGTCRCAASRRVESDHQSSQTQPALLLLHTTSSVRFPAQPHDSRCAVRGLVIHRGRPKAAPPAQSSDRSTCSSFVVDRYLADWNRRLC